MDAVSDLIKHTNIYLSKRQAQASGSAGEAAGPPVQTLLLRKASTFVTRMLTLFGVIESSCDRLVETVSEFFISQVQMQVC